MSTAAPSGDPPKESDVSDAGMLSSDPTMIAAVTEEVPKSSESLVSESDSLEEVPLDEKQDPDKALTSDTSQSVRTDLPRQTKAYDLGVQESSLEDRANILSHWMLSYLNPLLKLGATKVIDADDVGVPSAQDRAEGAYNAARSAWEEQEIKCNAINIKRKKAHETKLAKCTTEEERKKVKPMVEAEPSIATALVKSFGAWKIAYAILLYVISALLAFVPVLILNALVKFFESGANINDYDGFAHPWVEVAGLGVLPLLISALQTRHQVIMAHCAVYVRTAVSTLLFRKSLCTSAAGRAKTSTGQVVNMMSNDTSQLQHFLQFAGMTLVAPLQIIISLVLIYGQVGNATWVGVGFMVFLIPINIAVFSVVSKMRLKVLKYSDLRVKMMNEILTGIRIIKFYAWVSLQVARLFCFLSLCLIYMCFVLFCFV
jgi:hypothetical protein